MRGLMALLLALLIGGYGRAAEVVPWLYDVAVPVADQSSAERQRAASAALLQLLTRLTGLSSVPRTPEVTDALSAPERFYNQFRFAQRDAGEEGDEETLELVVQFDPTPVQDLVRAAGLPIWRTTRERVVAWTVIQEGGARELLGATSPSPLVAGMTKQAEARGVPLTLPLLDLEDQLAVDPAAVWGRLSQVVDPASERYGADVLLLGRLTAGGGETFSGQWEFWVDGQVVPFTTEGGDLEAHGVQAVNVLADELASRRVVHGRQGARISILVSGVATPGDYGALLGYMKSLEFVDQVGVLGLTGQRLWLTLDTPAGPGQLLDVFERDGKLYDDTLSVSDSADLKLIWQGGD